ncbi:DUF4267 domain-containing protein [Spirillospora sp. CA-108201]
MTTAPAKVRAGPRQNPSQSEHQGRTTMSQKKLNTVLATVVVLFTLYLGLSFVLPIGTSFPGLRNWPSDDSGFPIVKGSREIAMGLAMGALLVTAHRRALGWVLLMMAVAPFGDMVNVLAHHGPLAAGVRHPRPDLGTDRDHRPADPPRDRQGPQGPRDRHGPRGRRADARRALRLTPACRPPRPVPSLKGATVTVELNHTITRARDLQASAQFLDDILGLSVEPPVAHFTPVTPANQATLDYDRLDDFEPHHYAFMLSEQEFTAALARVQDRGITHYGDPAALSANCTKTLSNTH